MSKITASITNCLPFIFSDKTLIYIAAELGVEMFFRKIGRVAIQGDGK
jgi:hypothetical protein